MNDDDWTTDREMRTLTDKPGKKVGETYDLIDLDDTVQTFLVTAVNPSTIDALPGWIQVSRAINERRPLRWTEKFWLYWSPWKPWCWARVLRARLKR